MRAIIRFLLVLIVFGVAFRPNIALGQGGATGAINGTVEDTTGAPIVDADVQIFNTSTNMLVRKISTGSDGSFLTPLLSPGIYYAVINKSGFSEAKASGIEVRVTETSRLTITLKPGTVTEKVEISAQIASVDTTNATTGETIGPQTIRDLPLASQNYQQLLTLSTGAASELNSSTQLGRGTTKIFVNGQREDNNNYLIEGISATDYNVAQNYYVPLPNPDVIQEFKVQTSLYDATQGRNGGGNVNAVLKSGTSQLHGDAYEFFRNDVLNANEYFHNANGQERPPVKQNIFGGSLGGPVVKESLGFFFVNYQGTRQVSALSPGTQINNPGFPVIPTDRSDASISEAFFGNTTTPIDPVVHNLLNFKSNLFDDPNGYLIPSIPGVPGTTGQLLVTKPGKFNDDQFTTNYDKEFNSNKDKIGAHFFFSNSDTLLPFGAGGLQASLGGTLSSSISATDLDFPYAIPVAARFFSVNETHLFSPSLINDFRFGYVRMNYQLNNDNPVTVGDLGIDRPTNNLTQSIYKFTFATSGFQIGPTPPANQSQVQNNYNLLESVSWVKGAHLFRFGGEYTRVNLDKDFPQTFNGQIFFVNGGGLTDWQNFLEGSSSFSFGGGGVYNHEYRANIFGFYAQDDWKIRQNLTLNLGLRTDINGAFHDNLCHNGNIDEGLASQGLYPMIYGGCANQLNVPGLSGSGDDSTFKNGYATGLAPRIGLAYDLGGHHTTTVRAGYGIYYVREDVGAADQLSFQAPYLPISFAASAAGCLGSLYSATPLPGCPNNALPAAGKLDPNFIPCTASFQGFVVGGTSTPTADTSQVGTFGCAPGSPGSIPTTNLFMLAVPRKFVTPSTQQWNLTLQRDLGKLWVLEVGYVGTHATHLRETRTNIPGQIATPENPINITAADGTDYQIKYNTINNGPVRSPIPAINGYGGFQIFANDAYSHYNAFQTTLSKRWGHGYFQGAYTYSKSTDATSTGNTALNTAYNDESDLKNSRGYSDFDRPHRLAVSYRYDLPFFSSSTGFVHAVLGGWAVSGITIIQSGTPFSVTDSTAGSAYLGPGYTPTLTGSLIPGASIASGYTSGDIHNRLNGYLNVNQFTSAALLYPFDPANPATTCDPINNSNFCTTEFGNLGRNTYRGPYQQNWDFSIQKNFQLTERVNLRFATDFFNIFNHASFANPAINDVETITHDSAGNPTNDGPFGKIFSTVGNPRLIQFSLRLAF
jgi:hypothetical protein